MKSDLEIARQASLRPIVEIARAIGLSEEDLILYGRHIAKVLPSAALRWADRTDGKVILVTAMTPTSKGEGKTTTTIGLAQALAAIGKKAMVAVREPSLGPCMGVKGGAAGGGYSQVLPMEEINLHFTGDFHAVSIAHNLLAAMVDNHLHHGLEPALNSRQIVWRRVMDMNDRSLRSIIVGLQEQGRNGVMREDGFDITAASEIMAILCLATDLQDLKNRLSKIIVGNNFSRMPVTAGQIGAQGAMTALLKNALYPNLVQTVEGVPAFVHGGPFANIAHGCNSLIATRTALRLADYVVTEAGFGADLGAEKFFDITCRFGKIVPSAAVLVITRRALAVHGFDNVVKHAENIKLFGVPVVISINRFLEDSDDDLRRIEAKCADLGLEAVITDFRESGGSGGVELAQKICTAAEMPSAFRFLYELDLPLGQKIEKIAKDIYGAKGIEVSSEAREDLKRIEESGYGNFPICMAKTQTSLSDNPKITGRPRDFTITVSSARICAGAGFVVVSTGKIMTMPGLPSRPAALSIDVDSAGNITGLF